MSLCECGCGQKTRLAPQTHRGKGWVKGRPLRFVGRHRTRVQPEWPGGVPRYCECGCGSETPIATKTALAKGYIKGQPIRYIHGHNKRSSPYVIGSTGYQETRLVPPEFDSMRDCGGYVLVHRLVMAEAIGRPLSVTEHVHHINEDKLDNRLENLQIVTPSEHARIHWKAHA